MGYSRSLEIMRLSTSRHGVDSRADAAAGKIVHEMRGGEMAALGEVPFGKYYGSGLKPPP